MLLIVMGSGSAFSHFVDPCVPAPPPLQDRIVSHCVLSHVPFTLMTSGRSSSVARQNPRQWPACFDLGSVVAVSPFRAPSAASLWSV